MATRNARLAALAKLNLGLKVLGRRPDGYHELRTIFQTISLADSIDLEFTPGKSTRIDLESELNIPDNLIVRAAEAVLEASGATGRVRFRLDKRIPLGGGLGGGSTDAAAVLLGLPALLGRRVPLETLEELAAKLGSDVPFFLYGGTALGLGRGTEVYPLPDLAAAPALVVAPDLEVSTTEAYRALGRGQLTGAEDSRKLNSFRRLAWACEDSPEARSGGFENDFEAAVFRQHPELASIARELRRHGADPAMLTGSGAAVFGLFRSAEQRDRASSRFARRRVYPVALVSRRRYRFVWRRQLRAHIIENTWPPQSRHTAR